MSNPTIGCRTSSRNKKPSNYARYIQEYQQQTVSRGTGKKAKENVELSSEAFLEEASLGPSKNVSKKLPCLMANGRRLNVQIVFSNNKKRKPKTLKPKEKVSYQNKIPISQDSPPQKKTQPNQQKPDEKNLLFKLLFAFKEMEQQDQGKTENKKSAENGNNVMAQSNHYSSAANKKDKQQFKRKEKDEDDKYARYLEKMKKLDEKFAEVSQSLVLL